MSSIKIVLFGRITVGLCLLKLLWVSCYFQLHKHIYEILHNLTGPLKYNQTIWIKFVLCNWLWVLQSLVGKLERVDDSISSDNSPVHCGAQTQAGQRAVGSPEYIKNNRSFKRLWGKWVGKHQPRLSMNKPKKNCNQSQKMSQKFFLVYHLYISKQHTYTFACVYCESK